jgi:hypothetical protein
MLDHSHDRLIAGIHKLVCGMSAKELRALKTRYADNPDGWKVIEQARAATPPDCSVCAANPSRLDA